MVGSPATDLLAETAGRLGIWLSVGVDERDERDSTIYNTLLHFAPDGTLAAQPSSSVRKERSWRAR